MKYPVIASRGIVVFPGYGTNIEVGRKVSLEAIRIAEDKTYDSSLVVVSQKSIAKEQVETADDIYSVGTLVKFSILKGGDEFSKTIHVSGISRVKLTKVSFEDGVIFSETEVLQAVPCEEKLEKELIAQISRQLNKSGSSLISIPRDVLENLVSGIQALDLVDALGHHLPISVEQKQAILEAAKIQDRLQTVLDSLKHETELNNIDKDIDKNVRKTLDNQQKEFLLRERLKAIKEELGDVSSKDADIDSWREAVKDKRFPKEARDRILEEIKKYESIPPISAEANVTKGYIEWLVKLPWEKYSKDKAEIEEAKKVLEKHHFGLEKVKERIIEHIAVKINTQNANSPIICFVGPPGVGKTSLAKSIAEAVGREFIKISLGGLRDEAEIRGHRKTYVGAMPGKIIQAVNKAKVSNPVILLDEIDKMSSDHRGDPTSAMLEVLDPEQNKHFQDHFIEIEYDLSNVMFIATANYYEQIPAPLLDRVEIIQLEQYTSEEKLEIGRDYIMPDALSKHGLTKELFNMTDDVLDYVIDKYTREAGVRNLQRVINKLARKIVVRKLDGRIKDKFTIDEPAVRDLLGKEQVTKEKLEGVGEIGLVNGMYYSSVGGGVLPIEVTTYKSEKGDIRVTGSLKDVMKESLSIALGFIRANAEKFKIDFDWEKTTIQVHVPEGATPKDGPSAGTAFTTALISALTHKPVPKEIALTGEITLRGKVYPIGGLKEKTIGAVEAGVRTIFIPKGNVKDTDELANKVKELAKIIPVEDYIEIFNYIFLGQEPKEVVKFDDAKKEIAKPVAKPKTKK